MAEPKQASTRRLLDPVDRVCEAIFGLIMALTFTCTLSVAGAGHEEVHTMMIGALGCNIAWGLVDGVMHLMANFVERGRGLLTLRAVRGATDPKEAHGIVRDALPPLVASNMNPDAVEELRASLSRLADVPSKPSLHRDDWLGAIAMFFWCFVSTFPVVIPFMLIREPAKAMRVSNAVAVTMLFVGGWILGKYAAHRPWLMGLVMALVGGALVAITIALGG